VIFVPTTILDGFCRKLLGGGARLGVVVNLGIAMLFNTGEIVMRILSKRQLKELVLYLAATRGQTVKVREIPQAGSTRPQQGGMG